MAALTAILFVLVFSCRGFSYSILSEYDEPAGYLMLPTEYHVKAEKIDFLQGLRTPMELWYSAEYNRSRIDVFDTVKKYFYWEEDYSDRKVYIVHPKSENSKDVEYACYSPEDEEDDSDFLFAGNYDKQEDVKINGKVLNQWTNRWSSFGYRFDDVMLTYRNDNGEDVPVQIYSRSFEILSGAMNSHVLRNYYDFEPTVSEEDLQIEVDDCKEETVIGEDFHKDLMLLHPSIAEDISLGFDSFKKHHKKNYKDYEHELRKQIFHKNWLMVEHHNRQNLGYKLELNKFSDYTPAELRRINRAHRARMPSPSHPFPHSEEQVREMAKELPEQFDLRLEGVISPVKDQGGCGSCWAFATVAAVEGALSRHLNDSRLLDLSEQSVMDCDWDGDNQGCEGGQIDHALRHVWEHGIPLEEEYGQYMAQFGSCHLNDTRNRYTIKGFSLVTPMSADAMKVTLYKYGPVAVGVQATDKFLAYANGVFYDPACTDGSIDHAVTVVGWGVRDGTEYWIVKNSYGQTWGQGGYILMSAQNDNCYVLTEPYYAIV